MYSVMSVSEGDVQAKIKELMDDLLDKLDKINEAIEGISANRTGHKNYTWKHSSPKKQQNTLLTLEKWYNSAFPLVSDYLPDRKEKFEDKYQELVKILQVDLNYIKNSEITSEGTLMKMANDNLTLLINIVKSIPDRIASEKLKAKKTISENIVSDEVQKSKQLLDEGHVRAAGVVAGVALERHLLTLCESSEQEIEFDHMDGITSLAQTLSAANEINDDDQRLLEYLSGVRNKCSHASKEDPKKREVERMLDDTDEFIRQ